MHPGQRLADDPCTHLIYTLQTVVLKIFVSRSNNLNMLLSNLVHPYLSGKDKELRVFTISQQLLKVLIRRRCADFAFNFVHANVDVSAHFLLSLLPAL